MAYGTTTIPHEIGVDYGFNIYPPLERTKTNQKGSELFLHEVLDTYGPRDGDGAEQGDGSSVVRVSASRRNRILISRLANIHTYHAGVSTSCGSAPRSAAGHSLNRIFEECTRLRSSDYEIGFTFGMR